MKIASCSSLPKECTGKATGCVIDRKKTVYDSDGWKQLWPTDSDIDFTFIGNSKGSNSLKVRILFDALTGPGKSTRHCRGSSFGYFGKGNVIAALPFKI